MIVVSIKQSQVECISMYNSAYIVVEVVCDCFLEHAAHETSVNNVNEHDDNNDNRKDNHGANDDNDHNGDDGDDGDGVHDGINITERSHRGG